MNKYVMNLGYIRFYGKKHCVWKEVIIKECVLDVVLQHLSTYSVLRDINPMKRSADMAVTRLEPSHLH